jgi:hypothetical protein
MTSLPVTEPQRAAGRLDFEVLISDISARFVNISAEEVEREVLETLCRVREFFDVDRCGLLEVIPETGEVYLTHYSLAEGSPPVLTDLDHSKLYPWTAERLVRNVEVVNQHTRDYPREAHIDRASAERTGTLTVLGIPLVY